MRSDPVSVEEQQPSAAVRPALEAADRLAGTDWSALGTAELRAAVVEVEQLQARLDATRIALAEALVATGAAEEVGWASAQDFVTAAARGQKGTGPALVRLTRRLADLPATREALTAGAVSRDQVTVIANKVHTLPRDAGLRARAERLLVDAAGILDATDLARAWPEVVAQLDPDGSLLGSELALDRRERAAHQARFLSFIPDQWGGVRVRGYTTVEDAERLKAILMPLAAPVVTDPGSCGGDANAGDRAIRRGTCPDAFCAHDGRDPREAGARLWDALLDACVRAQDADLVPTSHRTPARLIVTTQLTDLQVGLHESGDAGGAFLSGDPASAALVRQLACDAEIIPAVMGGPSQLLDVGRDQRLVTGALWVALVLRDRHCAFPGCTRLPLACDAHHIVHWADGGTTALSNLVLLCRRHHTFIHHTPWQVRIDHDSGLPEWIPPPDAGARVTIRRWDPGGRAA